MTIIAWLFVVAGVVAALRWGYLVESAAVRVERAKDEAAEAATWKAFCDAARSKVTTEVELAAHFERLPRCPTCGRGFGVKLKIAWDECKDRNPFA